MAIPANGYVMVFGNDFTSTSWYREPAVGTSVTLTPGLTDSDTSGFPMEEITAMVSGGPRLVENGAICTTLEPGFQEARFTSAVTSRTALGKLADGKLVIASTGSASIQQLRELMLQLGCVEAVNLDGGGSTTMIAKSGGQLKLMNRPSDGAQRQVANGILVVGYDEKQPGIGGAYHTLPTASVFTTAAASGTGISTRAATEAGEAQEPPPDTTKAVSESTAEITRSGATATASTDNGATKSAGSAPSLLPIMMIAGCAAVSVGAAGYLLWWKKRRLR